MHAVITKVSINNREEAERLLKEQLIPAVSQAPGFATGYWMNLEETRGTSVTVFESEDQARSWADQMAPPSDAVSIESVEVGEVVGQA